MADNDASDEEIAVASALWRAIEVQAVNETDHASNDGKFTVLHRGLHWQQLIPLARAAIKALDKARN
jgi:hypothetical protein